MTGYWLRKIGVSLALSAVLIGVGIIVVPGSDPGRSLDAGLGSARLGLTQQEAASSPDVQPPGSLLSAAEPAPWSPLGSEIPPTDLLATTTTSPSSTTVGPTTSSTGTASTDTSTGSGDTTGSTSTTTASSTTTTTASASTSTPTSDPGTTTTTATGGACFTPDFRDDFNGSDVANHWIIYDTPGTHSPHSKRHPEAVAVADGRLSITAENDADGVLMSGGLALNRGQTYGRYSVRVRTEKDMTNATSGVVLTWPTSNNQPRDGENNFYETLWAPGDRSRFFSYIHEPFDDHADGVSQSKFTYQADASQWQTVTMEWTPGSITITREGPGVVPVETVRVDETAADLIPDAPHFVAIQLDQFKPTLPDGDSVVMEVDWIETWSYCGP